MSEQILTQKNLKEMLHYSIITGDFTNLKNRGSTARKNKTAGSFDSKGYKRICIEGNLYKAHRLAWFWVTGEWPANQIDHVNGIKDANYWLNLREATNSENCKNQTKRKSNTSGYKGVSWHRKNGKWVAQINISGKRKNLGYFETVELADAAYRKASQEFNGEFSKT